MVWYIIKIISSSLGVITLCRTRERFHFDAKFAAVSLDDSVITVTYHQLNGKKGRGFKVQSSVFEE